MQKHSILYHTNTHTYPLLAKTFQAWKKSYIQTSCAVSYCISVFMILSQTLCCSGIPWHGSYFNSIPQPAENWGLGLWGLSVRVHVYVYILCMCVCVCVFVQWLSCVVAHMNSDKDLIAVSGPKANAVLDGENPPSLNFLSSLIYSPLSHRWAQTGRWWMAVVLQGAFSFFFSYYATLFSASAFFFKGIKRFGKGSGDSCKGF